MKLIIAIIKPSKLDDVREALSGGIINNNQGAIRMQISKPSQVQTQLIGILATVIWCAVATFVTLKLIDLTLGLRVSAEEEIEGLDVRMHNETGYNY